MNLASILASISSVTPALWMYSPAVESTKCAAFGLVEPN